MKDVQFSFILALVLLASPAFSQDLQEKCRDVVSLKDGSVLRGKITEYIPGGDLMITTWSGLQMRIPTLIVKRIEQKCKDVPEKKLLWSERPYSFQEIGWYHATRFAMLGGESGRGYGLQHSSGLKLNRLLGIGLGFGFENFNPDGRGVSTSPIFAEVRGYLLPKNITPFYSIAAGWGVSKKVNDEVINDGLNERWKGGWMAQGQIGYRLGNHAFIHFGIRLQHKTRIWETVFWTSSNGVDQILHKRFDIGVGILL